MTSKILATLATSTLVCIAALPLNTMTAHAEGKGVNIAGAPSVNTGVGHSKVAWKPTPAQQRAYEAKAQRAATLQVDGDAHRSIGIAAAGKYLTKMNQHPQERAMWCGPSAFVSIAEARGKRFSQAQAAQFLRTTDKDGTDVGHMARALTQHVGGSYQAVRVPGPTGATNAEIVAYKQRLLADINDGYGLALNTLELSSGPRLPGHPRGMTIDHIIAVYGYSNGGALTDWIDPVAGAPAYANWRGTQAYGDMSSTTIMHLVAGREYTW